MSALNADVIAIVGEHLQNAGLSVMLGSIPVYKYRVLVDNSRYCCIVEACGDHVSVERVRPLGKKSRYDLLLYDVSSVPYGSTVTHNHELFRPPVSIELSNPEFLDVVVGTVRRELRVTKRLTWLVRLLVTGCLGSSALALLVLLSGIRLGVQVVTAAILLSWVFAYLKLTAVRP